METNLEDKFDILLGIPCSSKPLFKPEDYEKFLENWQKIVTPKLQEQERILRSCNPPA